MARDPTVAAVAARVVRNCLAHLLHFQQSVLHDVQIRCRDRRRFSHEEPFVFPASRLRSFRHLLIVRSCGSESTRSCLSFAARWHPITTTATRPIAVWGLAWFSLRVNAPTARKSKGNQKCCSTDKHNNVTKPWTQAKPPPVNKRPRTTLFTREKIVCPITRCERQLFTAMNQTDKCLSVYTIKRKHHGKCFVQFLFTRNIKLTRSFSWIKIVRTHLTWSNLYLPNLTSQASESHSHKDFTQYQKPISKKLPYEGNHEHVGDLTG